MDSRFTSMLNGIARCRAPSGRRECSISADLGAGWFGGDPLETRDGSRDEVTELVVDAPVVQVLPEPQVQVSLRLPFFEQIVDVPVSQERIVLVDVLFPQVIERLMEVTKSSSQDRVLQSTKEQILNVTVLQMSSLTLHFCS